MLPSVVELELWSVPGAAGSPYDGKEVAERCRRETDLSPTVVMGLNFVPDQGDVAYLGSALASGELRDLDFRNFCEARDLEPRQENERSAAEFLAFKRGRALAWLHLPAGKAGLPIAQALWAWASRNGMQVRDGASTYEVLNEGQVYALWQRSDA